jgi:hypothetical protein
MYYYNVVQKASNNDLNHHGSLFCSHWLLPHFRHKETVPIQQGLTKYHTRKMYRRVEVQSHTSLTSAVSGNKYSASCRNLQYQSHRRLGGPQSQSFGTVMKRMIPNPSRYWTHSHYTDWSCPGCKVPWIKLIKYHYKQWKMSTEILPASPICLHIYTLVYTWSSVLFTYV